MFMSEYNHTLDTKGRLIIPAKFREVLGEEFVISKGMDGCLFVYANDDWNAFEQKLTSLPLINKEARQFARFFLAGAATVEVDKQGRILLPAALREFAGLEKDVVLPMKYISTAWPDGGRGYGIAEVYGVSSDMWTPTLKKIV